MKFILITTTMLLASCQTTEPEIQTECLEIGSSAGPLTLCPLPAGIICVSKGEALTCFQLNDPILRADRGR